MALQIQSPFPSFSRNHRLLQSTAKPKLTARSQSPSGAGDGGEPAASPPKKPVEAAKSSSSTRSNPKSDPSWTKKMKGTRKERERIIRRPPVQEPVFAAKVDEAKAKEQGKNESAFLITWLGLGVVILVQGLGLAASGFLPEEWDKLFVKYLYASFTPTVFLFVAGTVVYGVLKYLQNEKLNDQSGTK